MMPAGFVPEGTARRFGRRVAAWRALHEVRQEELARRLGVSVHVLKRVEKYTRERRLSTALTSAASELTGLPLEGRGASLDDRGTWFR